MDLSTLMHSGNGRGPSGLRSLSASLFLLGELFGREWMMLKYVALMAEPENVKRSSVIKMMNQNLTRSASRTRFRHQVAKPTHETCQGSSQGFHSLPALINAVVTVPFDLLSFGHKCLTLLTFASEFIRSVPSASLRFSFWSLAECRTARFAI